MANDVFDIATDLSIRYFNATLGAYVEIVADSFEIDIDRGIEVESGVFAEGSIGTATVKLVKKNLSDFLNTPGYKAGQQFDIRYQPLPDSAPGIYNTIYAGWIQNVSMNYINESQTLEITIVANDAMKVFQNTVIPSFSVTGTVVNRSFRNCMINLTAAINAATTYPGGVSLTALGAGASGTTQRAFTWIDTPSGEIASKFMDAELGWYFTGNTGGVQYLTRSDINTLQAVTYATSGFGTVSNVHYTNLITNGNFEVNTTGWVGGASVTLSRVTTQFYSGIASLRAASSATTSAAYSLQTNSAMGMSAGIKNKASIWVRSEANTPTARVQIAYLNSGGSTIQLDSSPFTAVTTTGWTELSVTSVSPVGTASVELRVQGNKTSAAIASLFADLAKIENLTQISSNHFCLDNIDLRYDSDILVNKCIVIDGTAGTKTVRSNATSIAANGEQSATFTVDFDPAGASTYAQWATEVANAATIKQVYGVTTPPIRDDGKIGDIANWGVGTTLQVEFAQDPLPALQVVSIVSRINHIITPQHWEMNIGLWRGM
jgi:hypothetical protein